jgi:hypothetical protein
MTFTPQQSLEHEYSPLVKLSVGGCCIDCVGVGSMSTQVPSITVHLLHRLSRQLRRLKRPLRPR